MLRAERTGRQPDRYALGCEQRPVGTVTLGDRMAGATIELDATTYEVRAGAARGSYELLAADGTVAAVAESVHRRGRWTLRTAGRGHTARRGAVGTRETLADDDGRVLGSITRSGRRSSSGAVSDLAGTDMPVEAFALTLVLMRWRRRRRIAARVVTTSTVGR